MSLSQAVPCQKVVEPGRWCELLALKDDTATAASTAMAVLLLLELRYSALRWRTWTSARLLLARVDR